MEREQGQSKPFRFLDNREFAGLSQAERISYLQRAMAALRGDNSSEIAPTEGKH